jgi:alpha-1,2-mannosyltransferase
MQKGNRVDASRRSRRSDQLLAGIVLVTVLAYLGARYLSRPTSIDLLVYRVEGRALWSHTYLYGPLPTPKGLSATYPPFAALLFVTLIWLPTAWLSAVAVVGNLALLFGVAVQSCRLAGITASRGLLAPTVLFAAAVWCEPVFTTLRYGQINLLLLAIVLWDFTRPPGSRWMGVGIGVAAGIKVTPAIFIAYLLLTRRFRAAATASATFALTIALPAVLVPHATREYWTSLLFDSARVGHIEGEGNQSLLGVLARVRHTAEAGPADNVVVLAVVVAGLACAALAYRRLGERWGLPACAVTSLLAAPIAWTHHFVWVVPIAALLWRAARYTLVPTALIFWSFLVWAVPHQGVGVDLHLSPALVLLSASYALAGLGFLLLTAQRCRRKSGWTRRCEPVAREWTGAG